VILKVENDLLPTTYYYSRTCETLGLHFVRLCCIYYSSTVTPVIKRVMGKRRRGKKKSSFSLLERDALETYLSYYHYLASEACFGPDSNDKGNSGAIQIDSRVRKSFETQTTWMSDHEFPSLSEENVRRPYLEMPDSLETKERRILYELCIYVGLYHTGAGKKFSNRYAVISVHPHGFDQVPDLEVPLEFPVLTCKPWYYRNDHISSSDVLESYNRSREYVKDETKTMTRIIEDYMAYPYQCVRDDIDTVQTLSNPPPFEHRRTSFIVDTKEKMNELLQELKSDQITELAFDLEAHNQSKYKQVTCLLQLSTNLGHDYVIDVLSPNVWNLVSELQPIFSNPKVVKIGHGISSIDVPSLHRDFGIFVVNVFDTMDAASQLGLNHHLGLTKLCKYYQLTSEEELERYAKLKDNYQVCDWRVRPLTDEMVEYSVLDVRFLCQLRRLLLRDLIASDNSVPATVGGKMEFVSPLKLTSDISKMDQQISRTDEITADELLVRNEIEMDSESISNNFESNHAALSESEAENYDDGLSRPSFFTAHDSTDDSVSFRTTQNADNREEETELRYMPRLMDVLSSSQQQCLRLWSEKKEPPEKTENLLLMMQRADRYRDSNKRVWNKDDMILYYDLVDWRDAVARNTGTMPSLVCTLNLLVFIAYQRPNSVSSLKKLNYLLPILLREQTELLQEIFSIVDASKMKSSERNETESDEENSIQERNEVRRTDTNVVFSHRVKVVTLIALFASCSAMVMVRYRKK
jgi:ribonuclease D